MALADTNTIIRTHIALNAGIIALFAPATPRIYCPRLPENAILPAIGFFTRGGTSTPYIPDVVNPSVQFDCWADNPIDAREVYRALYNCLQGIQEQAVVIGVNTYYIHSAIEEVQGMDLVDNEIPNYYRVLTFFSILIRAV